MILYVTKLEDMDRKGNQGFVAVTLEGGNSMSALGTQSAFLKMRAIDALNLRIGDPFNLNAAPRLDELVMMNW